MKAVDCAKHSH